MYENELVAGANYEHLFATYNATSQDPTTAPLTNSLFNMNTMQQFLALGQQTQNIATDSSLIYGDNFELSDDWIIMANILNLSSGQQAYLLWLWLDTAYSITYSRSGTTGPLASGSAQLGWLSMKGAQQFEGAMTTMMLEFPGFTFATALAQKFVSSNLSCSDWYTTILGWSSDHATALCADTLGIFSWTATNSQVVPQF